MAVVATQMRAQLSMIVCSSCRLEVIASHSLVAGPTESCVVCATDCASLGSFLTKTCPCLRLHRPREGQILTPIKRHGNSLSCSEVRRNEEPPHLILERGIDKSANFFNLVEKVHSIVGLADIKS